MPTAEAVYASCTVVDAPGASVLGRVMPLNLNCAGLVPLKLMAPELIVRFASPVFLIVSDWFGPDPVPPAKALAMSLKYITLRPGDAVADSSCRGSSVSNSSCLRVGTKRLRKVIGNDPRKRLRRTRQSH